MLPAVDNICHPMRRRLAPVGGRTVSNPIKRAQSPVSKQSSDIGAFRTNADVVVRPSASPLRLDPAESKSAPPFFIVSKS